MPIIWTRRCEKRRTPWPGATGPWAGAKIPFAHPSASVTTCRSDPMSESALGTVVGNLAHAAPHRAALTCGTDTISRAALDQITVGVVIGRRRKSKYD